MNTIISISNTFSSLVTPCAAIAERRGLAPGCTSFELEDSILRASRFAWDIGDEAVALHVQITNLITAKEASDEASRVQAEADAAAAALLYVPWAISNADLRRGLIASGINPQNITNYLFSLPEGASKWSAITDWEYANYIKRVHPMLDSLAPTFNLTSGDINAIFKGREEYPTEGI